MRKSPRLHPSRVYGARLRLSGPPHRNGLGQGGQTNIDDVTPACKPHDLFIQNSGWSTRKRKDGRTEWIPPPHLDTAQARVNNYHHPRALPHRRRWWSVGGLRPIKAEQHATSTYTVMALTESVREKV